MVKSKLLRWALAPAMMVGLIGTGCSSTRAVTDYDVAVDNVDEMRGALALALVKHGYEFDRIDQHGISTIPRAVKNSSFKLHTTVDGSTLRITSDRAKDGHVSGHVAKYIGIVRRSTLEFLDGTPADQLARIGAGLVTLQTIAVRGQRPKSNDCQRLETILVTQQIGTALGGLDAVRGALQLQALARGANFVHATMKGFRPGWGGVSADVTGELFACPNPPGPAGSEQAI